MLIGICVESVVSSVMEVIFHSWVIYVFRNLSIGSLIWNSLTVAYINIVYLQSLHFRSLFVLVKCIFTFFEVF